MSRKWAVGLGIGAVAAMLALGVEPSAWLGRVEGVTLDWRARAFARPGSHTDQIKVILLDQASLDWAFRTMALPWPWPREVYGALVAFLHEGGARAVAFDVLYTESSYMGVADDEQFGEAIRGGPPFALAVHLSQRGREKEPEVPAPMLRSFPLPGEHAEAASLPQARMAALPVSEIGEASTLLGHVVADPDMDGIIRRATPWISIGDYAVPLLGLAAFLSAEQAAGRPVELRFEPDRLQIGARDIPLDGEGRALLRYRGPSGTHEAFSAAGILQAYIRRQTGEGVPQVDPEVFRDAYVLFGFSAPGLMDLRPTPLSRVYPGVEVHATFLDNFLSGDFLRPFPAWASRLWILFLGLVPAAGVVLPRRIGVSVLAGALGLALPASAAFGGYGAGWVLPMAAPMLAASFAVIGAWLYNYATEGRQKAFIKQAFRHYLSPAVIERLLQDPSQLRLGGERKVLTIFFSDLQGFSSIAERLDPGALTSLLNAYLSEMTGVILEEGGTLDKYEGDAIIAFWNAPLEQPDHAVRAVRAALRCCERLRERGPEYRRQFGADLRMRIGIHTGEVVVGNLGSGERFDYTVLGDAANLASRLEGANKAFGTCMMVSESTWRETGDAFRGRRLGRLRVVGRAAPVGVVEPLGFTGSVPADASAAFDDALRLFEAGQHRQAREAFQALAEHDPAAAAYAQRCALLSEGVVSESDGVWNLASK